MSQRPAMVAALKQVVQPFLRSVGFTGGFPHFRRIGKDSIDLVTFQFDRYGGGFVIEIARCPPTGIVTHWGESVPAGNTTAHDIHPDYRKRIQQQVGGGTDSWFRFDSAPIAWVAEEVLRRLSDGAVWRDVQMGEARSLRARQNSN